MKWFEEFLIRKYIGKDPDIRDPGIRARFGFLEAWVSIVGNVVLSAAKLFFALMIGSIALRADAFHTFADVLTSVAVIFSFSIARKPADSKHPYGHGRIEPLIALILAVFLIGAGLEFAHVSINRILSAPPISWSWGAVFVMVLSACTKEWMARFSMRLGDRIGSDALRADAWHHRSDAIASVLIILSLIGTRLGFSRIDAVFGLLVSLFIMYTGYDLAKSMISSLLGEAPSSDEVSAVLRAAMSVKGVHGIHGIEIHQYGPRKAISLHVEVPGNQPTIESHRIAEAVEESVSRSLNASTVVHVDTIGDGIYIEPVENEKDIPGREKKGRLPEK